MEQNKISPFKPRHKGQVERLQQQIERAFNQRINNGGIQVVVGDSGFSKTQMRLHREAK